MAVTTFSAQNPSVTERLTVGKVFVRNRLWYDLASAEQAIKSGASRPFDLEGKCERLMRTAALATENKCQLYGSEGSNPLVYLVGYDYSGPAAGHVANFVDALAVERHFQDAVFWSEGYTGKAILFYSSVAEFTGKINKVLAKHNIEPEGNDSFELRKDQFDSSRRIKGYLRLNKKKDLSLQFVLDLDRRAKRAISCFSERERAHFFPHIMKHIDEEHLVVYLLHYWHVLSPILGGALSERDVGYAGFVPKFGK